MVDDGGPGPIGTSLAESKLNLAKLRAEVWELRFGWLKTFTTTFVTAVVTVLIAAGGWYFQANADRQKLSTQMTDSLNQRFVKARENLIVATNASSRVSAARDLGQLTAAKQPNLAFVTPDILQALEARLMAETDPDVLRTIATVIGGIGTDALTATVQQNRTATARFAVAYGDYLGSALSAATRSHLVNVSAAYPEFAKLSAVQSLDDELVEQVQQIEVGGSAPIQQFVGIDLATRSYPFPFLMQGIKARSHALSSLSRARTINVITHYAQVIAASSMALEQILRQPSLSLRNQDLSKIALIDVDVSHVSFASANLSQSYFVGQSLGTDFSDSNLTSASLSGLSISSGNFTRSILTLTYFDDLRRRGPSGAVSASNATFTGANWWDSCMWTSTQSPRGKLWARPTWLSNFYKVPAGALSKSDSC